MKRAECIAMLYPELDDKLVVTIMGACAQELYDLGHKDNFFYLQHAMGLASSMGLGIAAGAYFAGRKHVLLMQNHGFLAAINGIVSLAQLYTIPLCMLVALRGHWGEPYPWHTRGGIVTEGVLRALNIPFEYARNPETVGRQIREAYTLSQSSLSPVALLLTRDLMEEAL